MRRICSSLLGILLLSSCAVPTRTAVTTPAAENQVSSRPAQPPAPLPPPPPTQAPAPTDPPSPAEDTATQAPQIPPSYSSEEVLIVEEVEPPAHEEEAEPQEEVPQYDVPIVLNDSVESHIKYFQTKIKDRFELWLARSGRYIPLMKEIFKSYGLPEDLVFVALIESGFNPAAYSRARAVGPWQFIRGTGKKYGLRIDEFIDERRDPIKSTVAAAKYLKDLYNMFGEWPLALASYNAGEGRVMRAMARSNSEDFWHLRSTRYLRRETRNYVPKFMAATIVAKNPEKYGFKLEPWEPLRFDEVVIEEPTDLRMIAKAAGSTYDDLKQLNPELRTTITPLNYKNYVLKLPYGTKETFLENFSQIPSEKRTILLRHRVRRGETLTILARRYGTTIGAIRQLNRLRSSHFIREGSYLLVPMSSHRASLLEGASPADAETIRYRVRRGDTLSGIARRFGTTVWAIRNINRLADLHLIRAGSYLNIPVGYRGWEKPGRQNEVAKASSKRYKKVRYRVRRGDSLWKISRKFNVPISKIRQWNRLNRSTVIKTGQHLVLYVRQS